MRTAATSRSRQAFTLIELMVSSTIALIITGSIVMLLFYTSREQVHGYSDNTVEEKSYLLVNNITSTIRSMSASVGITPNDNTIVTDANGNTLGYQSVFLFSPISGGGYTTAEIYFDPTQTNVVYIPDMNHTNNYSVWMTNNVGYTIRNLCFNYSYNADGSRNSSLVNVILQMDDNSFSMQNATNNAASVYRSFSVLMLAN